MNKIRRERKINAQFIASHFSVLCFDFFLFILFELKSSLINISILWGSEKYFYFSRTSINKFILKWFIKVLHINFLPSALPHKKKNLCTCIYAHSQNNTAGKLYNLQKNIYIHFLIIMSHVYCKCNEFMMGEMEMMKNELGKKKLLN